MFPPEKPRRNDNSGGWEEPRRQLIFGKDFLLPSFHPLFCLYFSPTERNNKKKFPIKDSWIIAIPSGNFSATKPKSHNLSTNQPHLFLSLYLANEAQKRWTKSKLETDPPNQTSVVVVSFNPGVVSFETGVSVAGFSVKENKWKCVATKKRGMRKWSKKIVYTYCFCSKKNKICKYK